MMNMTSALRYNIMRPTSSRNRTLLFTIPTMSSNTVKDKTGQPINIGDTVTTRIRGGKRTGEVRQPLRPTRRLEYSISFPSWMTG